MSTEMDFQEFCELRLTPRAGADQAFFEAADQEREAMFPMPPTRWSATSGPGGTTAELNRWNCSRNPIMRRYYLQRGLPESHGVRSFVITVRMLLP
jgi:hypothetical protein